jgi:anti-sigma regulatory factor (Ser/Thr protein kinase)
MGGDGPKRRQHDWRLPMADTSPALARQYVEEAVRDIVRPARLRDVLLLTTELVTNAVKYGRPYPDGRVALSVETLGDAVRVAVGDGGSEFEWAPPGEGESLEGRWGLRLVDALSSSWGVSVDGIKAVWFEIERATATSGPIPPGSRPAG